MLPSGERAPYSVAKDTFSSMKDFVNDPVAISFRFISIIGGGRGAALVIRPVLHLRSVVERAGGVIARSTARPSGDRPQGCGFDERHP